MKTKVKICGITNIEDALLAESLGADFIGLIFSKKSPRNIDIKTAKSIIDELTTAQSIGVFVEQIYDETIDIARDCRLWGVQHYTYFKDGFEDFKYIYALPMSEDNMQKDLSFMACDYLLLDAYDEKLDGGTGRIFDWSKIPHDRDNIFLAGGLNPDNIYSASKENVFALDLSSGVEEKPGKKNHQKLELLFKNI